MEGMQQNQQMRGVGMQMQNGMGMIGGPPQLGMPPQPPVDVGTAFANMGGPMNPNQRRMMMQQQMQNQPRQQNMFNSIGGF